MFDEKDNAEIKVACKCIKSTVLYLLKPARAEFGIFINISTLPGDDNFTRIERMNLNVK